VWLDDHTILAFCSQSSHDETTSIVQMDLRTGRSNTRSPLARYWQKLAQIMPVDRAFDLTLNADRTLLYFGYREGDSVKAMRYHDALWDLKRELPYDINPELEYTGGIAFSRNSSVVFSIDLNSRWYEKPHGPLKLIVYNLVTKKVTKTPIPPCA